LEVWLLVHWAPPGKNVRDPKSKILGRFRIPDRMALNPARKCGFDWRIK
jgi:hypothetical protein